MRLYRVVLILQSSEDDSWDWEKYATGWRVDKEFCLGRGADKVKQLFGRQVLWREVRYRADITESLDHGVVHPHAYCSLAASISNESLPVSIAF